jgi:EpsI family protein
MAARVLILTVCFLTASAYIVKASKTEAVPIRESLSGLPMQIGEWRGSDVPLDDRVLSILGVDDYLSRAYVSKTANLGIYVGFYQTQRQGSAIHSPMNCLPGAGWNPVNREYINVPLSSSGPLSDHQIRINRILIEKGLDKAVVLYWYQAHGRVVANEYWGKFYSVVDAMRMNRTDGALVRVVSSFTAPGPQAEAVAEAEATKFVQLTFPLLSRFLPE